MHNMSFAEIKGMPRDLFNLASYDDFKGWNRQWGFRERVRNRARFWGHEIMRAFAVMGGMIP